VEGLKLAPDTDPIEKIKDLEAQIGKSENCPYTNIQGSHATAQLKNKLYEHQVAPGSSPAPSNLITQITSPPPSTSSSANRRAPDVGGIALPHSSLALVDIIAPEGSETPFCNTGGSPELQGVSLKPSDPFMDLLFSGWDPDLPDPNTLNH
jgi:hypothetical protein